MFTYHCLNPISKKGLEKFTDQYEEVEEAEKSDVILVRSAAMHDMELGSQVKAVARAGAGVNNIPLDACAKKGVVVFNTPGANANGVKELVIAGMLLASRGIVDGIQWVREHKDEEQLLKMVEKQKKAYAGTELEGKTLGVIGLGAIGELVANAAVNLGMDVYGYDPYLSVDAAWNLSRHVHHAKTPEEIYQVSDYITIHVPALDATKGMINKEAVSQMKEGVILLNMARDLLINEADVIEGLNKGKIRSYVTDFATPRIAGCEKAIAIPHLGASTEEAEDNCAKMAVKEAMDFLENGNICNSVNYPRCDMGVKEDGVRITVMHENVTNMIGQVTGVLAEAGINITNMTNKSRGDYAYTMIDAAQNVENEIVDKIQQIEHVIRVRAIR